MFANLQLRHARIGPAVRAAQRSGLDPSHLEVLLKGAGAAGHGGLAVGADLQPSNIS